MIEVTNSEIRILGTDGTNQHSGMGFVISVDRLNSVVYFMTCAHVVAASLSTKYDCSVDEIARSETPPAYAHVDVTLTRERFGPFRAEIVSWYPERDLEPIVAASVAKKEVWKRQDIAVLKIQEDQAGSLSEIIDIIQPVSSVCTIDLTNQSTRSFSAFGFERFGAVGRPAFGEVTGSAGSGWWSMRSNPNSTDRVVKGFSGGGAFTSDGRLIGMIVAGVERRGLSFLISVRVLRSSTPLFNAKNVDLRPADIDRLEHLCRNEKFDDITRALFVECSNDFEYSDDIDDFRSALSALLDMKRGERFHPLMRFLVSLEKVKKFNGLKKWLLSVLNSNEYDEIRALIDESPSLVDRVQVFFPAAAANKVDDPSAKVYARLESSILNHSIVVEENTLLDCESCLKAMLKCINKFDSWNRNFRIEVFVPVKWLSKCSPDLMKYESIFIKDFLSEDLLGHIYAVSLRVLERTQPFSPWAERWRFRQNDFEFSSNCNLFFYQIGENESSAALARGTALNDGVAAIAGTDESLKERCVQSAIMGGLDYAVWGSSKDTNEADAAIDAVVSTLNDLSSGKLWAETRRLRTMHAFSVLWDDPSDHEVLESLVAR